MIIRRRHTANYTTIGNALFEDERLSADEVGILAFLLSRPNHWEVRRPALMRRWKVGRDAIKRIMTNLIRTGWCRAQKTRLSNGTFHIVYEIRDEPGRELSEDEVRGALSLVSSGAADAESEDEIASDQVPATGDPPTGQPGVADQHTAGRRWPIEDSENPESVNPESTKSARAFSDIRAVWPSAHVLSIVACESIHAGLTDALKEAAFRGARPYLDDCKAQNRKVCDLATYYRERRWERFLNKGPAPEFYVVVRATPQAARWREWLTENEPHKLATFETAICGRGWTAPAEWPPKKGTVESHATDPPESLMTEEDSRELINLK